MTPAHLTIAAVAALAAAGKLKRRSAGSRSLSIQHIIGMTPELRMRWHNAVSHPDDKVDDTEDVEDFYLSDQFEFPQDVRSWWEKTTGTEYIGHGNYRVVFGLDDDHVLKIALDYHGEGENQRELDAWDTYEGTDIEQYLVPIVEGDERYVLMKRAVPLSTRAIEDRGIEERLNKVSRQFDRLAFEDLHSITDTASPSNWGLMGGKILLVDYPMED